MSSFLWRIWKAIRILYIYIFFFEILYTLLLRALWGLSLPPHLNRIKMIHYQAYIGKIKNPVFILLRRWRTAAPTVSRVSQSGRLIRSADSAATMGWAGGGGKGVGWGGGEGGRIGTVIQIPKNMQSLWKHLGLWITMAPRNKSSLWGIQPWR